jgi:hypothetical protein
MTQILWKNQLKFLFVLVAFFHQKNFITFQKMQASLIYTPTPISVADLLLTVGSWVRISIIHP